MRFVFVRHGETNDNTARVLIGQTDPELNEWGIQQSMELLSGLEGDFQVIYASPLKRTRRTAEILGRQLNIPLILRDELKERDVGSLAGETWEQINEQQRADLKTMDARQKYDYRPFGGESVEQVKQRILKFIGEALSKKHKRVLVVSHAGVIRIMYDLFSDGQVSGIRHASIHEFELCSTSAKEIC